jgi:hypothetical protein
VISPSKYKDVRERGDTCVLLFHLQIDDGGYDWKKKNRSVFLLGETMAGSKVQNKKKVGEHRKRP